jgi:ABC-type amino acid transport substrate-binding protein
VLDFASPCCYGAAQAYVKKGGPQIGGVRDLFGRRVGVSRGMTYEHYLKQFPQVHLKVYPSDADAIPGLSSGKIRFLLTGWSLGQLAIKEGKPLEASGRPLFHDRMAFAQREGEADWRQLLSFAVRRMHRSGALRDLSMQWYQRDWTTWRWSR